MRKKLLLILVASVLVTSTLFGCGTSPTLTILSMTEGEVFVMKAGTGSWIEAQVGTSIEAGDMIKTGSGSSARITFLDGSTIVLEAGTEIEVVSLDIAAQTGSTTIRVEQTIGRTIFRVTRIVDAASRYEVETPTGVASVRGSVMQVDVIEDGTTLVTNLEGDIWAVAQGVELQIPEGEQGIIRPDEPPELVSEEVTFADPNLEAAVRAALGIHQGPVYAEDMELLTSLNADGKGVSDLSGLEYATSLTGLYLWNNQIGDVSPLAGLTSLQWLVLHSNQISDISPLAGLTNLEWLIIYANQISDVSPLTGLTNLENLSLFANQISDISALANLTNLIRLELSFNQISDISPLAGLTGLQMLYFHLNQVSDISPVANLTSLRTLYILGNQISDISPLAGLTSLTELWLGSNEISDISPLAGLTNLEWLSLPSNQISDISPLVDNPGLGEGDEVDLRDNPLSEQSINEHIPELEARGVTVDY